FAAPAPTTGGAAPGLRRRPRSVRRWRLQPPAFLVTEQAIELERGEEDAVAARGQAIPESTTALEDLCFELVGCDARVLLAVRDRVGQRPVIRGPVVLLEPLGQARGPRYREQQERRVTDIPVDVGHRQALGQLLIERQPGGEESQHRRVSD